MQFKTFVYSVLAATAAAQSLQDVVKQMPACAQTCIDTASPKIDCKVGDNACQCAKVDDLTKAALPCISTGCDQDEMQVALKVSTQICAIVKAGGADATSSASPTFANSTGSASGSAGSGTKVTPTGSAGASSTADPSTAGAAHHLAGLGVAAAAFALAL